MNKTDFLNIIGDTSRIDRQMLGEIQELVDIFPYFQSAHLLLLKGLQNNADVKFETQLRSSAIHIADREVLYYLLNTPLNNSNPEPPVQQPDTAVSEEEPQVEVPGDNTVNNLTEENAPDSVVIDKQDDPVTIPEAISEVTRNKDSDRPVLDETGIPEQPDFEISPDNSGVHIHENPESEISVLPESDGDDNSSELLELDMSGIEEPEGEIDKEADNGYIKKKLQSELIDRFIIANPRIEPNRDKVPVQSEDISKQSAEENGVFITETLARIYVSQGYYSKAIDIYEKLCLKFPEKSSYFATQIEKVKEHLKN